MIGTIKELSNRLRIGEQVLGQVELSVLTRLGQAAGWAKQVSKVRTVQGKGKPAVVWDITFPEGMGVTEQTPT